MQVESKTLFVTLKVPFKVGEVTGEALRQIFFMKNKDNAVVFDNEFLEIGDNIEYMGAKVEDFRTLKEFHSKMGINLNKLIDDATESLARNWADENTPPISLIS